MKNGRYNWYEVCIRWCWYTCKHHHWDGHKIRANAWALAFVLFLLPYAIWHRKTEPKPDLELF